MSTKDLTEADVRSYYSDIFNLPHWEPASTNLCGQLSHPRTPTDTRAAMFASFDALVGYKEAVSETARETDGGIDLSERELAKLRQRLSAIVGRRQTD